MTTATQEVIEQMAKQTVTTIVIGVIGSIVSESLLIEQSREFYRETSNLNAFKVWRISKHGKAPSPELYGAFNADFDAYLKKHCGPLPFLRNHSWYQRLYDKVLELVNTFYGGPQ